MKRLVMCCMVAACLSAKTVRVSASGGDFATIQAAVDYCALTWNGPEACVISIDSTFAHTSTGAPIALREQTTPVRKQIILRTSRIAELPAGVRVSPADASKMPKFQKSTRDNSALILIHRRASYYRLEGLEFIGQPVNQPDGGTGLHWSFINAYDESTGQFYLRDDIPSNIVVDRCYFHGPALGDSGLSNGVVIGAHNMQVSNSYFADISSLAVESHAIAAAQAGRNIVVRNNYISALSIGSITGGAAPRAKGYTTFNHKWLGNHYAKRYEWKTHVRTSAPSGACIAGERARVTSPEPDESWACTGTLGQIGSWTRLGVFLSGTVPPSGACAGNDLYEQTNISYPNFWECAAGVWTPTLDSRRWTEDRSHRGGTWGNTGQKNLWECKSCRGVLVEGNVFERSYGPGSGNQNGSTFLFNLADNTREAMIEDVVIRNNLSRNTASYVTFGYLNGSNIDRPSTPGGITIENNLAVNVGHPLYNRTVSAAAPVIADIPRGPFLFRRNTVIARLIPERGSVYGQIPIAYGRSNSRFSMVENILPAGDYALRSDYPLPQQWTDSAIRLYLPGADLRNNVLVRDRSSYNPVTAYPVASATWTYLPGKTYPFVSDLDSWAQAGFVQFANDPGTAPGGVVGGAGDYRLCTGAGVPAASCAGASKAAGAGLGGSVPGPNLNLVAWATEGTEAGTDNPWHDFRIRRADRREIRYTAYSEAPCVVSLAADELHTAPLGAVTDAGGAVRDRWVSLSQFGVSASDGSIYYARVTCEGGRFREVIVR